MNQISKDSIKLGKVFTKDLHQEEGALYNVPLQATVTERFLLLSEIQNIIRSYGWQSAIARLAAIICVPLYLLGLADKAVNPLFKVAPVICLFVLWLLDGHWKDLQKRYIILFHDALHSGRIPDLDIQLHESYNVGALWRPIMALTYVLLIGMFAIIGLR